jgi:hypothetical protein
MDNESVRGTNLRCLRQSLCFLPPEYLEGASGDAQRGCEQAFAINTLPYPLREILICEYYLSLNHGTTCRLLDLDPQEYPEKLVLGLRWIRAYLGSHRQKLLDDVPFFTIKL